jgi:hypothetical protein
MVTIFFTKIRITISRLYTYAAALKPRKVRHGLLYFPVSSVCFAYMPCHTIIIMKMAAYL